MKILARCTSHVAVAILCALAPMPCNADDKIDFNRDIRPILSNHCFQCHGPDAGTREADLRLDSLEGAAADNGNGPAITPGNVDESELVRRVLSSDVDEMMPPPEFDKPLSDAQKETLRRWIAEGASYAKHWSIEPIRRPSVPAVKDNKWVRNAIDHFVLARLESQGVSPSTMADRHTLIRRVYLDVLGLPPGVDEVTRFVDDERPDAYERMLDRVFANPHFGERWGRHWLDQARYADSHGYTNDNERSIWPYRDWVINAMNRDLPFDQFTIEQLAGDLLDKPTQDQRVATGFHRNTLINSEGGTKADQFRDEQVKDRVDTTGVVWLGLTVGCAKCHSHKYDAISQHEYYEMYSFFNSTADRNSVSPTISVPSDRQMQRLVEIETRRAELQLLLNVTQPKVKKRMLAWESKLLGERTDNNGGAKGETFEWTVLPASGGSEKGTTFELLDDKSLLAKGPNKAADEYRVTVRSPLTKVRSVRLEALTHDSLPAKGPGRASNGNFVLSEIWFRTGDGRDGRFAKAYADHSQPKYDVKHAIDNKSGTGWAINSAPEGGPNHNRTAWFVLAEPLVVEENHALNFTLQFNNGERPYNMGRFRISISADEWIHQPSADLLKRLVAIPADKRSSSQQSQLADAFLKQDAELAPLFRERETLEKSREALQRAFPATMVLQELPKPNPTHVHIRGDFLRPGDAVMPDVPAMLPQLSGLDDGGYRNRLDFAQWLMRPDHPMTARVRVNRIWMRLFGTGLVETDNDFGTQGSLPTHPQLLDWLSSEFIRQQWSTKRLLRLILSSATYRQSSHHRPDLADVDPYNKLLARQNRVRVEAEIVRDAGLSVSGLLCQKLGGPSVKPPQPDGVYAFTQRKKNWQTSPGEDRYRRGIYTFFYRSAPYPMLTAFDVPKFNQSCTRRDRSNTPLQSLTVANSEAMFEMAGGLADRLLALPDDTADAARLDFAFRLCLARSPSKAETTRLSEYLAAARDYFSGDTEDAAERSAWTAVARVLINLDEFITRE